MSSFMIVLSGCIFLLTLGIVLIFIRFVRGPSLPDRIVALDLLSTVLIGILAIYALVSGVNSYFEIALVFSLITFLGTMAFAYYLGKN